MTLSRRTLLKGTLAAGVSAGLASAREPAMKLKHSIASWCFTGNGEKWSLDKLCEVAKSLNVGSVELLSPKDFATVEKHKLVCAMASNTMPGGYRTGFNNPKYHDELVKRTEDVIDACDCSKFPNVIGFVGFKWIDPADPKSAVITRDDCIANCVKGLKRVMPMAEKRNVTVCIEHLNSRDGSHPMKGHPGYQGDDLDLVAEIIRKVGSPRCKLLFDVYHVQIMHGDVIRRLGECKDILGHIHTAGNPGRGELDADQEINYPAIAKKLIEMKYEGHVGHEFIPTRNPLEGLKQAIAMCGG